MSPGFSAKNPRIILGISAYYHDAAAALLRDGVIVAAAQEERFPRHKNDERFPHHAIAACLRHGALTPADLDAVVFYDKPIVKFARMLETCLAVAPQGLRMFLDARAGWRRPGTRCRPVARRSAPDECTGRGRPRGSRPGASAPPRSGITPMPGRYGQGDL